MWVVKFEFDGSKIFFGQLAKKFNIDLTGYPISSYEKNRNLYINLVGTIKGELKNKSEIFNFLKKSKPDEEGVYESKRGGTNLWISLGYFIN